MSAPRARTSLGSVNIPHLLLLPVLLVSAAGAVLWVCALVSVLRTATAWHAVAWVAATFVFPVLGPIVWFVAGRGYERTVAVGPDVDRPAGLLLH